MVTHDLLPTPGETIEAFCIRAHRALMERVPDPDERNQIVWKLWDQHGQQTLADQIAAKNFSKGYIRHPNVCHFMEHQQVRPDGEVRVLNLRQLAKIVRNCNERIEDTNSFAAISDGHTADPDDPFGMDPDILGYAGPYRIGMIGRKKPRWAIFGDEWHQKESADRLKHKPRRSVEIWTMKTTGKSHFDPIAALGGETPRLPLPQRYATRSDTGDVQRYSAVAAPAYPGGSNTYLPSFGTKEPRKKKPKFSLSEDNNMPMDPQDVAQVMDALSETPEFKYMRECMEKDKYEGDEAAATLPMPGGDAPTPNAGGFEGMNYQEEEAVDPAADPDLADLEALLADGEEEENEDEELDKFSRRSAEHVALKDKYSRLQKAHRGLVEIVKRQQSRLNAADRAKDDAERRHALNELAQKYGSAFVDVEEEASKCLYSAGSQMNAEQFKSHVATIEHYAAKAALSQRIPQGELDRGRPLGDKEDYERRVNEMAVKIYTRAMETGKSDMNYDEALDEAKKKLAG